MKSAATLRYNSNSDLIKAQRKAKRAKESERLMPARIEKAALRHVAALEKAAAYSKEYMKTWTPKNPEKFLTDAAARTAKWRKDNVLAVRGKANSPEMRAYRAERRAMTRQATPTWANKFFIREAYALADLRQKVCGGKWHVDHIVPLTSKIVCGLNCEANLQVISASQNSKKGNRYWPDMPHTTQSMNRSEL